MRLITTGTIFVFIFILILGVSTCGNAQESLMGKVIVIDPGHGGTHPGAVANGVREASVNLAVSCKLRDRLLASGTTVILTHSDDTNVAAPDVSLAAELQARVDVAKAANADIFVSLHANSDPDTEATGVISFYPTGRPNDLAAAIQKGLLEKTDAMDRGVRPANFYVLRNSDIPATLIEMGFLTNQTEAGRLMDDSYQTQLADGIYMGIINYFLARSSNRDAVDKPSEIGFLTN
jgi:N-acetylmuramoyl-L-alanine amidase